MSSKVTMQRLNFWLMSAGIVVAAVWVKLLLSDLETLRHLNSKFELTTNETNRPDYQKIGLVVHMNDRWADVEVWRHGRNSGFVSTSYIRRDISRDHTPPLFFLPKGKGGVAVPDESRGTGVILAINDGFMPLCFFVRDAWSNGRNIYGCGGHWNNFDSRTKIDWDSHFEKHGFDQPPLLLATEKLDRVPLSSVYDREIGIESCSMYMNKGYQSLDLDLFDNPRTQCAFGINKEAFALGLSISRERIQQYNELIVKEWSEMPNPVAAIFYVVSRDESVVQPSEAALFRDYALGIRSQYFLREGRVLPVYALDLDAFTENDKPLLGYSMSSHLLGSLTLRFNRKNEEKVIHSNSK